MTIYGVVNHRDGTTHLCTLQIAGSGPDLDHLLPCDGWRPLQAPPGVKQETHPSPIAGITIILGGCMAITVDAGPLRQAELGPGDMLILLDSRPPGHATDIRGPDQLRVAGVKFALEGWAAVRDAFEGWPDGMLSP